MSVNIIVSGITGRMGSLIAKTIEDDPDTNLIGGTEQEGHPDYPAQLEPLIDKADVVIDFTNPSATIENIKIIQKHKKAVVIGTTGFTDTQYDTINQTAKDIPCVLSPNMSPGVNLMFDLVTEISSKLKDGYDIEVTEAHHCHKKDAPSGTAKKIASNICKAAGRKNIPTHSIRAGEIVGDHTVIWAGPGEYIELTHHALSRSTFANGAVKAAKFAAGAEPALYSMKQVLEKH